MSMFLNGAFEKGCIAALNKLDSTIGKAASPEETGKSAVDVLTQLFIGLDGIGATFERLAIATEKLTEYAAIDINATVEQAIADRSENIAETAVEKFKKAANERSFIGKTT